MTTPSTLAWPQPPDPAVAPDPETAAFNAALLALFDAAPPPWSVPVEETRRRRAAGEGVLPIDGPLPEGRWEAVPGGGRMRVIEAAEAPRGVYLHVHGGGWTFGAADQFDGRNLRLSRAAGVDVLSAAYRLAPEHPWPACGDDVLAATLAALDWAQARGGVPLFIGGESAGAHLTAVALQRLRAIGRLGEVQGAVLIYGCFDLRLTPSARHWGERQLVLSTPVVRWFCENLLGPDAAARAEDPAVSPLLGDLAGMPPALLQVGDADPLLDDTLMMAARWRAVGAQADVSVWPGGVHGFDLFDRPEHRLPIALEAQAEAARWISNRIAVASGAAGL